MFVLRLVLIIAGCVSVCTCQLFCVCNAEAQKHLSSDHDKRPNVIVIMADDLGYRDVGCYGCTDFETPNIDRLAHNGVRCTSGYVSHPYCSPSRAGFLTGKYQQLFGHEHNPRYDEDDDKTGIDPATELLSSTIGQAGYATGLVGKWHLGAGKPFRPAVRGFNEFYGFLGGGHHYFRTLAHGKNYDSPIWRDHSPTDEQLSYLTDDLTTEANAFIHRNRNKPFCLMVMYNAPHSPDHVMQKYVDRVVNIKHAGRRHYAALVQGVDEGVGKIVATLDELNLTNETLVVFLSDNGGRRGVSDNRPLRGNKGWLHEGGIRVPFILSMPGTIRTGVTLDQPVISLDLLPTAMHLASIPVPTNLDGVNLMPHLKNERQDSPHDTLFWRVSGGEGFALRKGDWKLVKDIGMLQPELYNLADDLAEDHDLSSDRPKLANRLLEEYSAWSNKLEKPRWTEGHTQNTLDERKTAAKAGARQFPMPWLK